MAVLAVLAIALIATGCGSAGTLGRRSLALQSDAVRSLASEGALLAHDGVDGNTTAIFTTQHSDELAKSAAATASSLAQAKTKPALTPQLRRLRALAAQVRDQLRQLHGASSAQERAIAARLQRAADAAKTVGDGLG